MEIQLERAERRVVALEGRATELKRQIAELEALRERVRAEIVHMPKGEIVRAQDARSPFKIPIERQGH
jgi:multidrug resistance efflux pump